MIINIYNQTVLIAKPQADSFQEFQSNPKAFYPNWTNDLIASGVEFRHPKLVGGILVEKSTEELKLEGIISLVDGEKIVNNKLITVKKTEGLKVIWINNEWVETATVEEIEEHEFNTKLNFYNSELEFASKATAELACEIITIEMFEEVKLYMKAIDPFAIATTLEIPSRPSIFDRYQ